MFNYQSIKQALPQATLNLSASWQGGDIQFDSRNIKSGEMFLALKSARNGHDFVFDAISKGASAAIVDEHRPEFAKLPTIMVEDALQALEQLARYQRQQLTVPVMAITGSMGKTTLTQMLAKILGEYGPTHFPGGSFNNHIGVPLTLANTPPSIDYLVLEMGMNNMGEIAQLTQLGQPEIAIITNIAPVHIENLKTLENIASAKAEILQGLTGSKIAVLPLDNQHYPYLESQAKLHAQKIITFGVDEAADIRLISEMGNKVTASIFGESIELTSAVSQSHIRLYQVLVLGIARLLNLELEPALKQLKNFTAGGGRGAATKMVLNGKTITLIDESYNSSPYAMMAALKNLNSLPKGRKIVILGSMVELGEESQYWHEQLANHLNGVDVVLTGGDDMKYLAAKLPKAQHLLHFDNTDQFDYTHFINFIKDGDVVMIKGSNFMQFNRIIAKLNQLTSKQSCQA